MVTKLRSSFSGMRRPKVSSRSATMVRISIEMCIRDRLNQRKSWDELSYELGLVEPDAILTEDVYKRQRISRCLP